MTTILRWLRALLAAFFSGGRKSAGTDGGTDGAARPGDDGGSGATFGEPKWLKLARAEIGVKEIPGPEHNPSVLAYFRDAGFPEINDDETAWCAAYANAMLERAGYAGSKSLAARSFLTWGKRLEKPYPGCIAVFSRGDPRSWTGHVGFYVGESEKGILVLGGNQGNAVSIAPQQRDRLLGYCEPGTGWNSRTNRASALGIVAAGAAGTAILDSQTQLMGINGVLRDLGVTAPELAVIASLLQIAVFCVIVWARWDDAREKGR